MTTRSRWAVPTYLAAAIAFSSGSLAWAEDFKEGTDYQVMSKPLTLEKPNSIEVREFFWYGCSHCFKLEPHVKNWLKTKPADVNFVPTPAALNSRWEQNARGFYVVQMMGQLNKVHEPLFNEIHVKQAQLFDQASLASFYARYGVNASQFNALYNSFSVTAKVQQSKQLAVQAQISGVPTVIVNGKYIVPGENARTFQIVNYLIGKERAIKGNKKAA